MGAVVAALDGFPRPVVLIAGGRDKGGSYAPLAAALARVGRAAVLIGEAADTHGGGAGRRGPGRARRARWRRRWRRPPRWRRPGDAVVLSPACSSFDMFRDYAHRGEVFAAAVAALAGGGASESGVRGGPDACDDEPERAPGALPGPAAARSAIRCGCGPRSGPDRLLCAVVLCMAALGLVMVFSAGAAFGAKRYGDWTYFLRREALFTADRAGGVRLRAAHRLLVLPALELPAADRWPSRCWRRC